MSKPLGTIKKIQEKKPIDIPLNIFWGVFAIYTIAVFIGVNVHEPWRDEAQAWLLVRDLNLAGLFKTLPSEGHPPLWYLLIMPLAKCSLPYISQNYLAAIIMIATVYILIFKTKLPDLLKLALPFSYFFFYEYAVLARSYCLVAFFITLIIWLYPKRFEKPWLFAACVIGLFNTHMLTFGFATALTVLFYLDARKQGKLKQVIPALAIMTIGGMYLIPYLAFSAMARAEQMHALDHTTRIINTITGSTIIDGSSIWGTLLFLLAALTLLKTTKPLLLLIFGAAGVFYILAYRYNLADTRHYGVLFTILIGSYALREYYVGDSWNIIRAVPLSQYAHWSFIVMIALQLPQTFTRYKADVEKDFSGAKATAEFLTDNNLQNKIWVGHQAWAASAILPYVPAKKIYYPECARYGTYYVYDSCYLQNRWAMMPEQAADITLKNMKDSIANIIFIFNYPLRSKTAKYLDMIYHSPEVSIKKDETFYVYKFKQTLKQ